MNKFAGLLGAGVLAILCGCAGHTQYTAYEGARVEQGTGGTRVVVSGIDIWNHGTPPRSYKILGILDDHRGTGWIAQAGFYDDLAKQAKAAGGDAVIFQGSERVLSGVDHDGVYYKKLTRAAVIKYVK
jgi:hypothetical protein